MVMDRLESFLRLEVGTHPDDLEEHASRELSIPLSIVVGRVRDLIRQGVFEERLRGETRELVWKPIFRSTVDPSLQEDKIWRDTVAPRLSDVSENVRTLLYHGFTEMVNNVVDHSAARNVVFGLRRYPQEVEIYVEDDGIGIFKKLQEECDLEDPRHVALELAKGRLTTDPARHTGQGIFFTSRMCDKFLIGSETTVCGQVDHGPWHIESKEYRRGTTVRMVVRLDSQLTAKEVFDEFAAPEPGGFTRTAIQVDLVRQGQTPLISRSQAKRLLVRCENFSEITLDFAGIPSIGPAFADEVFRVFHNRFPTVALIVTGDNEAVRKAIEQARSQSTPPLG